MSQDLCIWGLWRNRTEKWFREKRYNEHHGVTRLMFPFSSELSINIGKNESKRSNNKLSRITVNL